MLAKQRQQALEAPLTLVASGVTARELFVRIPPEALKTDTLKLRFAITAPEAGLNATREAVHIGPSGKR